MRTLITPDLHHHTDQADHWLASQRHNRVVFLGDYFDDYGDNVNDARRTALWLRERMEKTADVFLLGNHDIAYMFPRSPELFCPGFTAAKARGIGEVLRPEHWQRFRLAHAEQGWLLSHAGFHPMWLKEPTVERILKRCAQAMQKARRGVVDPILGAGEERGGPQRFGGPLWMDWDSLIPISRHPPDRRSHARRRGAREDHTGEPELLSRCRGRGGRSDPLERETEDFGARLKQDRRLPCITNFSAPLFFLR